MNIIDVTLRESVYYQSGISYADAINYLCQLKENVSNKWIQYVEIGYLNTNHDQPLNYNAEYFSSAIDVCRGVFKPTAMLHIPKCNLEMISPEIVSELSLVRIVVGQEIPAEAEKYIEYFHNYGVKVSLNLTYISKLSLVQIERMIEKAIEYQADFLFCADSSGSLFPTDVCKICQLLMKYKEIECGMHLHNHMQMALANSIVMHAQGLQITDVSVVGAGKGGGNLKMEQALPVLYADKSDTRNLLIGLGQMIDYFTKLIGRNSFRYMQEFKDFLTGLYGLTLAETEQFAGERDTLEDYINYLEKEYLQ